MTIILLCIVAFVAAFVDAIAGGGGILSVPALLAAGIPPHLTLGTNKFAASWGSFTSSFTYFQSGNVYKPLMKYLIPFTFIGAIAGVTTALSIPATYLKLIVLTLLIFVSIYTLFKKDIGKSNNFTGLNKLNVFSGMTFALIIGFYDGFFGPGTGSFLLFAFIQFFGFNFTISTANAKILNFVSNIVSLILFALNGKIIYTIGLPMGISMLIGARLGSKVAIKHGGKIIKPIFIAMSLGVVIKLLYDMLL